MNILIIEDKDLDRLFIKRTLSVTGEEINLLNANSIKEGLAIMDSEQVDCILLDMHLPDGEKHEAFDMVFNKNPNIPIILLTGHSDVQLGLELIDKGAQDFINKEDINTKDLIKAIKFSIRRIKTENQLRELNATKDKFFSIMAHDLKNPLSIFALATDTLVKEYDNLDKEDLNEYLIDLKDNAQNIYNLLENLLTWSRTQRGKISFNPDIFDIRFIVDGNLQLYLGAAHTKKLIFENLVKEEIKVYSDSNLINTIIRNLVNNAIKFTNPGGKITISVDNNLKNYQVNISDTGVGMSELVLENLFRIDVNTTTLGTDNEKGTGLGLIVCKEFSKLIGGDIWASSELGKGSTFSFTIPKN
jgi:signal transduction histidine kinase